MPQREPRTPKVASQFRYQNHIECEENEDAHVVRPTAWPPKRVGNQIGEPSVSLSCELCNTNVIVYEAHATGEMPGVKVILPKGREAKVPA